MSVTHGKTVSAKSGINQNGLTKNSSGSSAWSVYLFQVSTGRIGPQVDVESGSWQIPLNSIESFKARLRKSSIPATLDLTHWLAPWWAGLLLMWNGIPIFAGPIVSEPTEDFQYIDLDCAGIRAIFAKRTVIPELVDMTQLANTTVFFSGMSLGTIAKRCVQNAMLKPGGSLPIAFPVPDETNLPSDSDHQRTYNGFDVQNLFCDDVLNKLSGVHNGPDIMFKPRLIDASRLVWDMWTGTSLSPRIQQSPTTPVWDTAAVKGSVVDLQIVATGSYMTDRVYSLGNGQNQGQVITISQNLIKTMDGYPLLETAINTSNSLDPNVVRSHGDADLAQNYDIIRDMNVTIRGDGAFPMGSFWSGDLVDIVTKGWLSVSDGRHACRLITVSGDMTANVKLAVQREFDYVGS